MKFRIILALLLAIQTGCISRKHVVPETQRLLPAQTASRADLLAAQGSEDTQERVLKSLLSDDYSKWKNAAIRPTAALIALSERFNLQESWERGLRLRPDLLQAQLNVEKQGYVVKFRKNQLLPQMDLVGDYGLNGSSASVSDSLGCYRQAKQVAKRMPSAGLVKVRNAGHFIWLSPDAKKWQREMFRFIEQVS